MLHHAEIYQQMGISRVRLQNEKKRCIILREAKLLLFRFLHRTRAAMEWRRARVYLEGVCYLERSLYFDEFLAHVEDLMASPVVRRMRLFRHHHRVTCLQHSVSVAYLSFLVVRRLGGDARAAARGGLLHDLFLYDRREKDSYQGLHGLVHPRIALANAQRYFELNELEREIILTHMFPIGTAIPRHPESLTVCLVDKYCAVNEFIGVFADSVLATRVAEVILA